MRILNLYAGIGGNRKLWGNEHRITAIELNESIAKIYSDLFPNDTIVVTDAHEYLLEHFKHYDFIWSSPPCPTHSQLGRMRALNDDVRTGSHLSKPKFPDMKLYEEIIFLDNYFNGKWVVENVVPYYEPLIPAKKIHRHLFWSNFIIPEIKLKSENIEKGKVSEYEIRKSVDLSKYSLKNKKTILRNCVDSELGLHIFNRAMEINKVPRFKQERLF